MWQRVCWCVCLGENAAMVLRMSGRQDGHNVSSGSGVWGDTMC